MRIHLKIYVIIFDSFCMLLLEHLDVFWMFLLPLVMFDMFFVKIFQIRTSNIFMTK